MWTDRSPYMLGPLLQALVAHGVDFVRRSVGWPGIALGSSYPTFDLDVAYARDKANLERLARVLAELRVTPERGAAARSSLPRRCADRSANGANFTFTTEFGSFDILGDVAGVRVTRTCAADATMQEDRGSSEFGSPRSAT